MQIVAAPVAPPSPGEVADDLWSRVEATLPAPVVVVTPPRDRAALLDQPAFVAVSNWTVIVETACDTVLGIVCVRLQATPRLAFDPGDGADVVHCTGRGTEYDPSGADPADQAAAPGACVHHYGSRTGTDGRPVAWSGTVTVTWDVSWSSTAPDASGSFPDFSLSAPLDRPVDEVQGVVVSSGDDSS